MSMKDQAANGQLPCRHVGKPHLARKAETCNAQKEPNSQGSNNDNPHKLEDGYSSEVRLSIKLVVVLIILSF